jgi:hypothetical protein
MIMNLQILYLPLDLCNLHFLKLSIDNLKMLLEAREYSQMQIKMVYQAYERNDIKIAELFEL